MSKKWREMSLRVENTPLNKTTSVLFSALGGESSTAMRRTNNNDE